MPGRVSTERNPAAQAARPGHELPSLIWLWLPLVVFFGWYFVMYVVLRRAIHRPAAA